MSPMLMDPHPSQQHTGLHNAVLQLQQEVTMPKGRLKPTLTDKSGVDGRCQKIQNFTKHPKAKFVYFHSKTNSMMCVRMLVCL